MISPKTILVVEDHSDVREAVVELLQSEGHRTVTASNGREALAYLLANAVPSLIILDLEMPEVGGWEVLAVLRCYPRFSSVPVLLFSGAPVSEPARAVYTVLPKSVAADVLAKMVGDLLAVERSTFG